jgi:hypothetical protein
MADAALRRQTADAGRAFVRQWYSAQRLAGEMESLYRELLDGKPELARRDVTAQRSSKAEEAMPAGFWE